MKISGYQVRRVVIAVVASLLVVIAVCLLVRAGGPVPTAASPTMRHMPPQQLSLYVGQRSIATNVESQCAEVMPNGWCRWPVNRTECLWSYDDFLNVLGNGQMDAGAESTYDDCMIADGYPHPWYFQAYAPKTSGLELELRFNPGGVITTRTSRPEGNRHLYTICAKGPLYDEDLPEVPNTDGGFGIQTAIHVAIRNISPRTIKDLWVQFVFSPPPGIPIPCVGPLQEQYPLEWQTS